MGSIINSKGLKIPLAFVDIPEHIRKAGFRDAAVKAERLGSAEREQAFYEACMRLYKQEYGKMHESARISSEGGIKKMLLRISYRRVHKLADEAVEDGTGIIFHDSPKEYCIEFARINAYQDYKQKDAVKLNMTMSYVQFVRHFKDETKYMSVQFNDLSDTWDKVKSMIDSYGQ